MFPLAKLDRNTTADGLKKFILEEEAKYVATNLSALGSFPPPPPKNLDVF